jgi:hypothetical protein
MQLISRVSSPRPVLSNDAGLRRSCRADFSPRTKVFLALRHSYAGIRPTTTDGGIANRTIRLRIAANKFRVDRRRFALAGGADPVGDGVLTEYSRFRRRQPQTNMPTKPKAANMMLLGTGTC